MSQETPCGRQRASCDKKRERDIQHNGVTGAAPAPHNIDRKEQNNQDSIGDEEWSARPAKVGKILQVCRGAKYKPQE